MRRFATEERVWVYDRQRGTVRRDSTHNVAVESEFYTVWTASGTKDIAAEQGLADLDHAGPIALDKLERGKWLDKGDRGIVAFFLAFAETRGPSFRRAIRQIDDQTSRIAMKRQAGHLENAIRGVTDDYRANDLSRMAGEYQIPAVPNRDQEVMLMVDMAFDLASRFERMAWMIGRNMSRTEFITSDRPIAVLPPEGWSGPYGCLMPGVTNIFPLSGRNCLLFGGVDPAGMLAEMPLHDDKIDEINRAIARHGDQYIIAKHERAARRFAEELRDVERERMEVIELYDSVQDRSFIASYCARHDQRYPFAANLAGSCPKCGQIDHLEIIVRKDGPPVDNGEYTRWLNGACASCGVSRRIASPALEPVW